MPPGVPGRPGMPFHGDPGVPLPGIPPPMWPPPASAVDAVNKIVAIMPAILFIPFSFLSERALGGPSTCNQFKHRARASAGFFA